MSQTQHPQGPQPVEIIFQMATGYMASSALNAVARLGIADMLSRGPRNVSELAAQAAVSEDILYRVMRALASVGVFVETDARAFMNSPVSEILQANHPHSVRPMVLWLADPFHFDTYRDMMPTIKDGKSAIEHIHHRAPFDVIFSNPELANVFNNAMTSFSAMVIPAVLAAYDFSGIGTLADIAGGHGFVITSILQKHPGLKGILFDLDHVLAGATERVDQLGLANRLKLEPGNFFEKVPAADAYIMKHIIHDWDDVEAIKILKNCGDHLKSGGRVILLESVLPEGNVPHMGKWGDIEMFMMPGGRERTEKEYADLFSRAGFKLNKIVPTQSPVSVIEAVKQ